MKGKEVLVCVVYFRNWDLKANLPFGNFTSAFHYQWDLCDEELFP